MKDLIEKYDFYDSRKYSLWVYLDGAVSNDKRGWYIVETYDVNMKPDCKVGSFAKNFWFRTEKGKNYKKHDSIAEMMRAIKEVASDYRLKPTKYRVEDDYVSPDEYDKDPLANIKEEGTINELIS